MSSEELNNSPITNHDSPINLQHHTVHYYFLFGNALGTATVPWRHAPMRHGAALSALCSLPTALFSLYSLFSITYNTFMSMGGTLIKEPQIPRFLQIFRGIWPMPLSLLNHSALALFAQRTRIPTSARSIGFCAIWVCISSSSYLLVFGTWGVGDVGYKKSIRISVRHSPFV